MEDSMKLGALAIGIILKETLPEAINTLKKSWYGYSDKNIGRMEAIREAYRECCYPYEKESDFYTVEPAAEKNTEKNQPNVSYPIYFEMDKEHHTLPKLFFDGFKPNTKQRIWERRLGKSQLKTKIQDLIGYICEFQNCRDYEISSAIDLLNKAKEKINSDNVFYYDPINMFCEELKYLLIIFWFRWYL